VLAEEALVLLVLVEVARRQHRRHHRYLGVELHAHQRVDHRRADELVAVDAAVDDQAARDDGVVTPRTRELERQQRDLEGAGHLVLVDLAWRRRTSVQLGEQGLFRLVDDVRVPGRADHRDAGRMARVGGGGKMRGGHLIHGSLSSERVARIRARENAAAA